MVDGHKENNIIDKIHETLVFLNENREITNDEIIQLIEIKKNMELSLDECNNYLASSLNSTDLNAELFSPLRSNDKESEYSIIKDKREQIENKISESANKLVSLMKKQKSLTNSIDCLKLLIECGNKDYTVQNDYMNSLNSDGKMFNAIQGIKILETQESERKRIARELHDSTAQNMTNLLHKTDLCTKLIDIDTIRAKLELQTMVKSIKCTINDMRNIIYDLRPMSVDDLGLVSTIERYIKENRSNNDVNIVLNVTNIEKNALPVINLTLFRIIQEASNNAIKHGNASKIIIELEYNENSILLTVKDNGKGFEVNSYTLDKKDTLSGFGLSIMKERVMLLSGEINIESNAKDGTKIFVKVPLRT